MAVRQLAAVMLKQYIDVHWSAESDKFRAPETTPAAKQSIRNMLPLGLKESISKVRNTVAFSLAGRLNYTRAVIKKRGGFEMEASSSTPNISAESLKPWSVSESSGQADIETILAC